MNEKDKNMLAELLRKYWHEELEPQKIITKYNNGINEIGDAIDTILESLQYFTLSISDDVMKKYEVYVGGEHYHTFEGRWSDNKMAKESAIQCARYLDENPSFIGSIWIEETIIVNHTDWKE